MYRRFAIAVLIAAPLVVMGLDNFHPRKKGEEAKDGQPAAAEIAAPTPPPPPANNYGGPVAPLAALPPSKADPVSVIGSGAPVAPPPRVAPGLIDPPPTGEQAIYVD